MIRYVVLALIAASTAAAQTCDRACLEGLVDRYMEALIAHDPKLLPAAQKVRNTEDGVLLELGDGFWRSAKAKGSYRLFVADVESGQVAFLGTMREDPQAPVIIAIRLKTQNQRISEIETVMIRDAGVATALENRGRPQQVFLEPVSTSARASRSNLVRVANSYLDGLPKHDGTIFTADCDRVQNGLQTTNNPNFAAQQAATVPAPAGRGGAPKGKQPPAVPKPPAFDFASLSCKQQFESGYFDFVKRIRDRRFTAVDRERGLVTVSYAMDLPSGPANSVKLADGRAITAGPDKPTTYSIVEVFRIEGGRIRRIEAVQLTVPYGMLSGWSTWEEGMSFRPRDMK